MLKIIQSEGDWTALRLAIQDVAASPSVCGIMVLACESNGEVPASFDTFLRTLHCPIFGGVFPALIADGVRHFTGNIVLALDTPLDVFVVPSLSDPSLDYDQFLSQALLTSKLVESRTMFAFVDGLSPRVGALMESLFNTFGLQGNFIGGGAGSLVTPKLKCIITPDGVVRDAAILAIPQLHSRVSVAHGWLPLAGPFEVTESDNNVILSLDWEPALDVYRQVVETNSGVPIDVNQFGLSAQSYPFGIARLSSEFVVRDPVAIRADGGLVCVGDVPPGSLVHIMHGDIQTLLAAAERVGERANALTPADVDQRVDVVIDCISRSMFMGEDIKQELAKVRNPRFPQIGAFTLGEVANSEQEYLEFHNKTAVVATIWEQQ
jgi:hypothetical protein